MSSPATPNPLPTKIAVIDFGSRYIHRICSQLCLIGCHPVRLLTILVNGICTEPKLRLSNQVKSSPISRPINVMRYEVVVFLMTTLVFDKNEICNQVLS